MSCATSVNPTLSSGTWQQYLKPVSSPENGIQIWIASVDCISQEEIDHLLASLDASERQSAVQFHFDQDRRRYIVAHGLLRLVLAETLGCSPETLVLEKSTHGKPELRQSEHEERHLMFNFSHAVGWALIAIGWDRQLGVDLETAESLPDDDQSLFKLAARVLSGRELELWRAIPNPVKRRAAFLRTWTRKEAYVKATGEGLRHDPANMELPADPVPFDIPSAKRPGERWVVHDLAVPVELTAALAVEAR
jgi:4'-phosphopantetheinyl transferase